MVCRWINSDAFAENNIYSYCDNNLIHSYDAHEYFTLKVYAIASVIAAIAKIIGNFEVGVYLGVFCLCSCQRR